MKKHEFEEACRAQNAARDREVAAARQSASACDTIEMLAFGGVPYCRAHRVMGPCPYGRTQKGGE